MSRAEFFGRMVLLAGLIGLAGGVAPAEAQEAEPEAPALWVNVGGFSRHFDRDAGFNENNRGIGLEYRASEDVSLMAGRYFNSVRRNTNYAGVMYQPLRIGDVRIGLTAGLMTGYPNMNDGAAFFAAIPMASYEFRRVGINFGVIPSVGKVEGTLLLQIKVRAF